MLPTLYIGDYLFVAKWPYGYSRYSFPFGFPSFRGRMFAHLPSAATSSSSAIPAENADLIKRVIGLPGDTIEVRGGAVILNGQPVPRERMKPVADAESAQQPLPGRPAGAAQTVTRGADSLSASITAYRETLPGGPSYTVLDQVDDGQADDFRPVTRAAGPLFLMGDNRDDSLDSRFPADRGRDRHACRSKI